MKDGEISESGGYQELLNKKGAFADFLIAHLSEITEEEEDLDDLKLQLESTVADGDLLNKIERAISRSKSVDSNSDTT